MYDEEIKNEELENEETEIKDEVETEEALTTTYDCDSSCEDESDDGLNKIEIAGAAVGGAVACYLGKKAWDKWGKPKYEDIKTNIIIKRDEARAKRENKKLEKEAAKELAKAMKEEKLNEFKAKKEKELAEKQKKSDRK